MCGLCAGFAGFVWLHYTVIYYIIYYNLRGNWSTGLLDYVLPQQTPGGFRRFLQEQHKIPAGLRGKPLSPVRSRRLPQKTGAGTPYLGPLFMSHCCVAAIILVYCDILRYDILYYTVLYHTILYYNIICIYRERKREREREDIDMWLQLVVMLVELTALLVREPLARHRLIANDDIGIL